MGSTEENSLLLAPHQTGQEILLALINKLLPSLFLLLWVTILYLLTLHFYYEYNANHVPRGDPFTYTINWFHFLAAVRGHYWQMLIETIIGKVSWYQLQVFFITLFSPILTPHPERICIVNFFSFFVATFFWFRLASLVLPNRYLALACSLLYWLLPSHYGVYFPIALFSLQLDTMFLNIYCAAVASMLIYSLNPKLSNAVWAAIMMSLTIWGRGNAIPYLLIGLFIPSLVFLKTYVNCNDRLIKKRLVINTSILFVVVLILAYFYYKHNLDTILTYYTPHYHIVRHSFIDWSNIYKMLLNVPGIFINFPSTTYITWIWTLLIHAFMIATALIILVKPLPLAQEQRLVKILCVTGWFIFYGTLFTIVFIFNASSFMLWHPYAPMLAGLYLEILAIALYSLFLNKNLFKKITASKFIFLLVAILALMYGYILSNKQTPSKLLVTAPPPKPIIYFATHMEQIFGNSSVAFLWYEIYNTPIINYYRIMNQLPEIPTYGTHGLRFYTNDGWSDLWTPTAQPDLLAIKKILRQTIMQANYLVIPDCINGYGTVEPYPLFIHGQLLAEVLSSPDAPRFKVKMILHDFSMKPLRLLVLQRLRKNQAINKSELLPKPFPEYPLCRKLTYHNAYIN